MCNLRSFIRLTTDIKALEAWLPIFGLHYTSPRSNVCYRYTPFTDVPYLPKYLCHSSYWCLKGAFTP